MSVARPTTGPPALSVARVVQTWWPLALSWLLMGVEPPAVAAVLSRLAEPRIHLAAYGSVVFPLSLLIEAPIIMLLAASTALCKDWDTYVKVRRFTLAAGTALLLFHAALAFTPLFDLVVLRLIDVPAGVVEPARLGLRIMTPWSFAIAYRRFQQGVLIRFGRSRSVGAGTILRVLSSASVLAWGVHRGDLPGVVVGATASATAVIVEALFASWRVRPILRGALREAPRVDEALTVRTFLKFYVPLSLTSLFGLLVPLVGSAGMSRMPSPLASLATWPVISGFVFLFRSLGLATNEVVVSLLDEPAATLALRRFRNRLATFSLLVFLCIVASPLADIWMHRVMDLAPDLAALARSALWFALPLPAIGVFQSWFQGVIVHGRWTRAIPEATLVLLGTIATLTALGVRFATVPGIVVSLSAIVCGQLASLGWLAWRSRPVRAGLAARDAAFAG